MTDEQLKLKLNNMLQRLDESAKKIVETRGYTDDAEKVKILEELIREQMLNENSRTTTR